MVESIIEVQHLYKKYRLGKKQQYYSLRDTLSDTVKRPFNFFQRKKLNQDLNNDEFWALKDINFNVLTGEIIGIIGRNGAGKSTLLKILSKITPPTHGQVSIRGRVASLLEVGTGFHPELTGSENIYLNGAILGMTRKEIKRKFDEIVGFSGVEKFLDTPVKHFSSGMYMRLAFSVAAHLDSEILIIDEVLAVGDAAFQIKCLGKMKNISASGRTILFISHNLHTINELCKKSVLLERGKIVSFGETANVITEYARSVEALTMGPLIIRMDRKGTGGIKFQEVEFVGAGIGNTYLQGDDIKVQLHVKSTYHLTKKCRLVLSINSIDQIGLISCDSKLLKRQYDIPSGSSILSCKVKSPALNPGSYLINIAVFDGPDTEDLIESAGKFSLLSRSGIGIEPDVSRIFPVSAPFDWTVKTK